MDASYFRDDRQRLENAFFLDQDNKIVERLRAQNEEKISMDALRERASIDDESTLRKLYEIGLSADAWAALELLPLVEVAWADGKVDEPERDAILRAAHDDGILKGTDEHALLEGWLTRRAGHERLDAWIDYVQGMMKSFDDAERAQFKKNLLGKARAIAESAGGFLGFNKISEPEQRMLDRLAKAFDV